MLLILDEKEKRTPQDIEAQYPNCKYLLTSVTDIENLRGYLYCVSTDRDSLLEMCKIAETMTNSIIMGSYNNGNSWLQYEIIQ